MKHIKIKIYAINNLLDDVEKPTWEQVGFFMSSFDIFCQ
ncbi:hypothetical protein J558_3389 [Acinetobacter baumannii 1106579]|nr:hypothetical protein J558_3389 [Acinetobacter baumannii 1106579]EXE73991.1 hypothetical protein J583_3164 [Acinetobacter baumannii 83444]KMV27825.1 hypothetical protein AB987_3301 [Acinetobacter baumannii]